MRHSFLHQAFGVLEEIEKTVTADLERTQLAGFLAKEFVENPKGNAFVIDKLASAAPVRPHAFSLAVPYTSWPSLTDRRFTGRHLPEAKQEYVEFLKQHVPLENITALFKRTEMKQCTRSSVMFMSFAQWFTDGFLRTDTDSCKNTSNHEIDLCQIYGLRSEITDVLRAKEGGRLKSQWIDTEHGGEEFPPYLMDAVQKIKPEFWWQETHTEWNATTEQWEAAMIANPLHMWGPQNSNMPLNLDKVQEAKRASTLFAMGTDRANSTLGYAMLNTLFLREHNRIAKELAKLYPAWDDEQLFQTARNIMIVLVIKIVVEDYIRHISGLPFTVDPTIGYNKKWYRTNRMTIEFNILYRWHSLAPSMFHLPVDNQEHPWQEIMYHNELLTTHGIGAFFETFSNQPAGQIGLHNTPAFLQWIEGKNIALAREHKLRSYTEYQQCFGLNVAEDFDDITQDKEIQKILKYLYKTVDKVEWYVGMLAEDRMTRGIMGHMQTVMVANDAFSQALTNPLLAEAVYNEHTFSKKGMEIIESTRSLQDVLNRNFKTPQHYHCSMSI